VSNRHASVSVLCLGGMAVVSRHGAIACGPIITPAAFNCDTYTVGDSIAGIAPLVAHIIYTTNFITIGQKGKFEKIRSLAEALLVPTPVAQLVG
jgi:hypothetical protein